MHKLRNTQHKEILERIMEIIPPGYDKPIFKNMKRKIRVFYQQYNWNEDIIRKKIEDDSWFYSCIFFND